MKTFVINKGDLTDNIHIVQKMAGNAKIIAVLKGGGYGLGLLEFAHVLQENGIDFFAVSEPEEAVALRSTGVAGNILLLSATAIEEEIDMCVQNEIILSAGSEEAYRKISASAEKIGKTARVHLKIDTGFGRFGFLYTDIEKAADAVKRYANVRTEGVYSHFSFSFSGNRADVQPQFDRFVHCVSYLEKNGIGGLMAHICSSCAFLQYQDMHLDAVRIGSAFLGRLPLEKNYGLKKIGVVCSRAAEVKWLPKGHFVGYANTYRTKKSTKIAVIPVGFGDGYGLEKKNSAVHFKDVLRNAYHWIFPENRKLSVRINGEAYPVIGRISMHNVILDVTDSTVQAGDAVYMDVNPILVNKAIPRIYE